MFLLKLKLKNKKSQKFYRKKKPLGSNQVSQLNSHATFSVLLTDVMEWHVNMMATVIVVAAVCSYLVNRSDVCH